MEKKKVVTRLTVAGVTFLLFCFLTWGRSVCLACCASVHPMWHCHCKWTTTAVALLKLSTPMYLKQCHRVMLHKLHTQNKRKRKKTWAVLFCSKVWEIAPIYIATAGLRPSYIATPFMVIKKVTDGCWIGLYLLQRTQQPTQGHWWAKSLPIKKTKTLTHFEKLSLKQCVCVKRRIASAFSLNSFNAHLPSYCYNFPMAHLPFVFCVLSYNAMVLRLRHPTM